MNESKPRRKLAAILAADVVNFSMLMGENEDRTLKNLKACRTLTDDCITANHGRVFGSAGDSIIADFASPVDAVIAATEFQRSLRQRNEGVPEEDQMMFRVGLNLGDVIVEGENLYGDGVNVAARLEAVAEPGGISLSGKFHDEVCRKLDMIFVSTGEQEMKNIRTPIPTYKIEISDLIQWEGPSSNEGSSQINDLEERNNREEIVDGHIIAIDLSEPMDRIVDKDEDLDYLDDYKLMNPYILKIAREKIAKGGEEVLKQFENGFKDARVGQYLDTKLKQNPTAITDNELDESYKKYRSVMGTAGSNMALSREPLGEIFRIGMGKASESVGCGNEIEDSIRDRAVKIPSWPLYYSLSTNDVKKGFELTMERSQTYLDDARKALELMPENFSHRPFLEFLFLTVEHYNEFWFKRLQKENIWSDLATKLPK